MLDLGLIATGVVIWAVLAASARWAPTSSFRRDEIIDRLYVPAFTGLLAGPSGPLARHGPAPLPSRPALSVIRSGVEFWPAVAAALAVVAWSLRRGGRHWVLGLAEVAPVLPWADAPLQALLR